MYLSIYFMIQYVPKFRITATAIPNRQGDVYCTYITVGGSAMLWVLGTLDIIVEGVA